MFLYIQGFIVVFLYIQGFIIVFSYIQRFIIEPQLSFPPLTLILLLFFTHPNSLHLQCRYLTNWHTYI